MKMIRTVTAALCLLGCSAGTAISAEKGDEKVPEKTVYERIKERGWDFKFKDFTVSAFCGPNVTDVEYRLYKECGFNVAITPRRLHYHEEGETREDGYKKVDGALDLAQKHGLAVVLETYAHGHTAWGGVGGPYPGHHHPATVPELKWINNRFGKHPALIGYMLADDIGNPPPKVCDSSHWMLKNTPHLWPWMCQLDCKPHTLVAGAQGAIAIPQFYPTLYKAGWDAVSQMQRYCHRQLDGRLRPLSLEHATLPMPMFNVSTFHPGHPPSLMRGDSVIRFQIYSSLAYGAQGIYYFTYSGLGSLYNGAPGEVDYLRSKAYCDSKWYMSRAPNHRVLAWGPELLERECREIYHSRWRIWNEKDEAKKALKPGESNISGPGKLIAKMPDDLLVGILRKKDAPPLAMVVDKRVSKEFRGIPPRDVEITFADTVKSIDILEAGGSKNVKGKTIKLDLESGDGQLLRLNEDNGEHKDVPPTITLPVRMRDLRPKREMFVGSWLEMKISNQVAMNADGTFELKDAKGALIDRGKWSLKGLSLFFTFATAPDTEREHAILEINDDYFVVKDVYSTTIILKRAGEEK